MTCRNCGETDDSRVIESVRVKWEKLILQRRRRRCGCGETWYTLELPEDELDTHIGSKTERIPRNKNKDYRPQPKGTRGKQRRAERPVPPAWSVSHQVSRRGLLGYDEGGEDDPDNDDLPAIKIKNYWED